MKRLIVGDIHGAYKPLIDVLSKANFNPEEDMLYAVGDYCDSWPQTKEVVDYLMSLKNFEGVLGNHDDWFVDWMRSIVEQNDRENVNPGWYHQGGKATYDNYCKLSRKKIAEHYYFLSSMKPYIIADDVLIVHGGCELNVPIENQDSFDLMWDRDLIRNSLYDYLMDKDPESIAPFSKIILGHTQTDSFKYFLQNWNFPKEKTVDFLAPFNYGGVWDIDTGAGWSGKLTVMDIDTEEYWQSDLVPSYYPEVEGRG